MVFRIGGDPMGSLREAAVMTVNAHFDVMFTRGAHRTQAHARKREVATSGNYTHQHIAEADALGLTPDTFAALILSKAAEIDETEWERQQILLAIAATTTPNDLDRVMVEGGIVGWSVANQR